MPGRSDPTGWPAFGGLQKPVPHESVIGSPESEAAASRDDVVTRGMEGSIIGSADGGPFCSGAASSLDEFLSEIEKFLPVETRHAYTYSGLKVR